ncbi:MAG: MunI family type II restriction endonuclease [Firmicutes bacterium]|nr:MunI family type II restriction endonuclease [Bacillota bacterium]
MVLSNRLNWEKASGEKAHVAEQNFYEAFSAVFKDTCYVLHKKPKHLKNLYALVQLPDEVMLEIYQPENFDYTKIKWGVSPDCAIENRNTGKILFGEIKRQDGWVEDKDPSAGRGNAHERLCKLFAPGLLNAYRQIGNIGDDEVLPFWVVFQGDITRDPKRVREIAFWFDKFDKNYFMWRPNSDVSILIRHFDVHLKKYLE